MNYWLILNIKFNNMKVVPLSTSQVAVVIDTEEDPLVWW